MIDLLLPLSLFTAFVLGRASARATWRRNRELRAELAEIDRATAHWRQTAAPVPEWPKALPVGHGLRKLPPQPIWPLEAGSAVWGGPARAMRWRHRRYVWVGFWAASGTPRDPLARMAAAAAVQRADSVGPLPEALRVFAGLTAPGSEATAAEALAATWAQPRELVGAAS